MCIRDSALRMSALNITPDDVSNAIKAQNVQAAAGSIGSEAILWYNENR